MGLFLLEAVIVELRGDTGIVSAIQAACAVALFGAGLLKAVTTASAGLQFIWRQYLRPAKNLTKYGKWAIVTGATDGIGRAYCDALAKQGAAFTRLGVTTSLVCVKSACINLTMQV